jgi:hypothetical protein
LRKDGVLLLVALQLPHLPGRTQLKAIGKLLDHYGGVLCVASLCAAAAYGFFYWLDENLCDAAKASLGRFCRERVRAWAKSRAQIGVFKFGPQQVKAIGQPPVNSFDQLVKVDAFRKLREWSIDVAIEAPAVKPWDCTAVKARQMTVGYIKTVKTAGGLVRFIAMDEPLAAGLTQCKQSTDEIVQKAAAYIKALSTDSELQALGALPEVGDIEAYPFKSVAELEHWIKALESQGAKPKFFHLDVNVHRLDVSPQIDARGDLRELKRFFAAEHIPFGVIFWPGYNPVNSDKNYYDRTMSWIRRVHEAIGRPDQAIFQSWVVRGGMTACANTDPRCTATTPMCQPLDPPGCGTHDTPVNLPENDPRVFSHLRLLSEGLRLLNPLERPRP